MVSPDLASSSSSRSGAATGGRQYKYACTVSAPDRESEELARSGEPIVYCLNRRELGRTPWWVTTAPGVGPKSILWPLMQGEMCIPGLGAVCPSTAMGDGRDKEASMLAPLLGAAAVPHWEPPLRLA